jgi:hypothetical protein
LRSDVDQQRYLDDMLHIAFDRVLAKDEEIERLRAGETIDASAPPSSPAVGLAARLAHGCAGSLAAGSGSTGLKKEPQPLR